MVFKYSWTLNDIVYIYTLKFGLGSQTEKKVENRTKNNFKLFPKKSSDLPKSSELPASGFAKHPCNRIEMDSIRNEPFTGLSEFTVQQKFIGCHFRNIDSKILPETKGNVKPL